MATALRVLIIAATLAVALAACSSPSGSGSRVDTSGVPLPPGVATTATAPADSGNGTRLVPSEIPYGTYKATPSGASDGYVEVCATLDCRMGTDGFLRSYTVDGPTYIVIPANAVAVTLRRVNFVLMTTSAPVTTPAPKS